MKKAILPIFLILSCFIYDKSNIYNLNNNDKITINTFSNNINNIQNIDQLFNQSERIIKIFLKESKLKEAIHYFAGLSEKSKNNLTKSVFYFYLSNLYQSDNKNIISIFYLVKISKDLYKYNYNGQPLGYHIAIKLINSETNFEIKEKMYKILLTDYKDIIDLSYTLFEFANLYKQNLDMDKAIPLLEKLYKILSNSYLTDNKINLEILKKDIDFYSSKKEWLYDDLELLIKDIKDAIKKQDVEKINNLYSKKNFEIKLFEKVNTEIWSFNELGINKRWNNYIIFSDRLEEFSTDNKLFLKTENWDMYMMSTWYFCFNKIDYPYDNYINGKWEWSGIYCGNPF